MKNSNIEWTDHTFNPWWGCVKVSEGCKHCYAEALDNRYSKKDPHWGVGSGRKSMSDRHWEQPVVWNMQAEKQRIKAKVFCASMADIFEDHPQLPEWRIRLFKMIEKTPFLIWQLLTKRPENVAKMIPKGWLEKGMPANVWMGTTVENQKMADERIPILSTIKVQSGIRFLSCEPLLEEINIISFIGFKAGEKGEDFEIKSPFQWVICGGESGRQARGMHVIWAKSLSTQCKMANIPFFFKQWGEHNESGKRVGKKESGSKLFDIEHKNFPK